MDAPRSLSRRNSTRRWLGIEFAAYVLLFTALVTVAWTHGNVSGVVVLVAWVLGGLTLTLAVRRMYQARS